MMSSEVCEQHSCDNPAVRTCKYCNRNFCDKHLEPTLSATRSYINSIKDPYVRNQYWADYSKDGGHPDVQYTEMRNKEMNENQERERKAMGDFLDSRKGYQSDDSYKNISRDRKSMWRKDNRSYSTRVRYSRKTLGNILKAVVVIMIIGVMYLLLFNPKLPKSILPVLSVIIYITEAIILVLGLLLLNGFGLGESDLGVWGFGILAVVLILLGIFFFFGSGFVSPVYSGYEVWFGIILGILGLFAAFRSRRRHGVFVYSR